MRRASRCGDQEEPGTANPGRVVDELPRGGDVGMALGLHDHRLRRVTEADDGVRTVTVREPRLDLDPGDPRDVAPDPESVSLEHCFDLHWILLLHNTCEYAISGEDSLHVMPGLRERLSAVVDLHQP